MPLSSPLTSSEREQFLIENLPTVRFIARRIHDRLPTSVELDDLVSAGSLGLMDAVDKFDFTKGVQFKTYAQFRIKGAMLDSLRDLDWGSRAQRRKAREVEAASSRLHVKLGRSATEQEIADEMNLSLADFQSLLGELRGLEIGSFYSVDEEGGEATDLSEMVADPGESPFDQYASLEQKRLLAKWIGELPEREKQVLSLYYYEELPMKEIGRVIGVVESRVSQLHSAAVMRLRARMASQTSAATAPPAEKRGRLEASH